jgi:hypothetical protein
MLARQAFDHEPGNLRLDGGREVACLDVLAQSLGAGGELYFAVARERRVELKDVLVGGPAAQRLAEAGEPRADLVPPARRREVVGDVGGSRRSAGRMPGS